MKKWFALPIGILLIWYIMGCAVAEQDFAILGGWDRDARNHWYVSEDGEKQDEERHQLEDGVCQVCGCTVKLENGNFQVIDMDVLLGGYKRSSIYSSGNHLIEDNHFVRVVDEENATMSVQRYYTGEHHSDGYMLMTDTLYRLWEDGTMSTAKQVDYHYNGQMGRIIENNEFRDPVLTKRWDEEGNVLSESVWDWTYHDDGRTELAYHNMDGESQIAKSNEYGDIVYSEQHWLDGTEVWRYEYVYDEDGNKLRRTESLNDGELTAEAEYELINDADGSRSYMCKRTVFEEDSKEITEYNEDETPVTRTTYFADGSYSVCDYNEEGVRSVICDYFSDGLLYSRYEYNDLGDIVKEYSHFDGKECHLSYVYEYDDDVLYCVYFYDENGTLREMTFYDCGIAYRTDGFDKNGLLSSSEWYNEDGDVIETVWYDPEEVPLGF